MGIARFSEAKRECMAARPQSYPGTHLTAKHPTNRDPSPEKTWKWSGTDFVKSPTEEPWVSGLYFFITLLSFIISLFLVSLNMKKRTIYRYSVMVLNRIEYVFSYVLFLKLP